MEQKYNYFADNLYTVTNIVNNCPQTKPLYSKMASLVNLAAQGRYSTIMVLDKDEIYELVNSGFMVRPLGNGEYYVGWYFKEKVNE